MSTALTHFSFEGAPRYLNTDDIYNGYLIPGGSIVLMNIWSVLLCFRRIPVYWSVLH
jgi:hypothetical protein